MIWTEVRLNLTRLVFKLKLHFNCEHQPTHNWLEFNYALALNWVYFRIVSM